MIVTSLWIPVGIRGRVSKPLAGAVDLASFVSAA